ncbi:MAG: GlsB/YeaQ/YmgE family stress response membrane protein [Chloroflexi bacterium]|nr:GlsB/YeaQ/YmgE family stress response membrane protein [Chloroflexota bacterium]
MNLDPGGLIAWLVVGLIAGWLAGQFMRGGGYGLVGDIIVGVIGAFIGGFIFSLLLPGSSAGLIGSIIVAFIGACILIAILRAVSGSRSTV